MKFYINNNEDLNEYEKEHNKISFERLIKYLFSDMIICNNIQDNIYDWDCEVIAGEEYEYTDEDGNYLTYEEYQEQEENGKVVYENNVDIYQWFFVDLNVDEETIKKLSDSGFVLYYSEKLDVYILGVTHLGTGWSYVLTKFEPTTDWESYYRKLTK